MNHQFTIYFGGSLFNHKDLTGNALLAEYIEKCSGNQYQCFLPQKVEQHQTTALAIRNKDLVKIIENHYAAMAGRVIENLDAVRMEPPLLKDDPHRLKTLYQWALEFPGGGIEKLVRGNSFVDQILAGKIEKGLA
jgi:hypothetical protein